MGQEIRHENYDLNDIGREWFYHTSAGQREMCPPCYLQCAVPVKRAWLMSPVQKAHVTPL